MNLQNLDWALWRSFLAILREGSLSAAARALDVAHPTVRRHLDELEARLDWKTACKTFQIPGVNSVQ
jgi:hypothetical protein